MKKLTKLLTYSELKKNKKQDCSQKHMIQSQKRREHNKYFRKSYLY